MAFHKPKQPEQHRMGGAYNVRVCICVVAVMMEKRKGRCN